MTIPVQKSSFSSGELSPTIFGMIDLAKVIAGASVSRNMFASVRGGSHSRGGLANVGRSLQTGATPNRLVPFKFSAAQQFILEFSHLKMRVIYQGDYVVEGSFAITAGGLNKVTAPGHNFSVGDWAYVAAPGNLNARVFIIAGVAGNVLTLQTLLNAPLTITGFATGGTIARIYTVTSPYADVDLPWMKFDQSADEMTIHCVNMSTLTEYAPYDLQRLGATNWQFNQVSFVAPISAPTGVAGSCSSAGSWYYGYRVTAVDSTGSESVASPIASFTGIDIAATAGTNVITWAPVAGAAYYNVYRSQISYNAAIPAGSLFGFVGEALGPVFVDSNITPDYATAPPTHNNPFARGAVIYFTMSNFGSGFSPSSTGIVMNSATGSGFVGTPVVVAGKVLGIIVENGGQGYAATDTATITGGGSAAAASGWVSFPTVPTDGQTIVLYGVTWTFSAYTSGPTQTLIGVDVVSTLAQLVSDLNASANSHIFTAAYSASGSQLNIAYKNVGTGGNAYTLNTGTTSCSVSGATLTGGTNTGTAVAVPVIGPQTGTYPGTVAYVAQRRWSAGTINAPDNYFASKPGDYENMDTAIPVSDTDSISGSPWATQVNGVQWLIPMPGSLLVGTSNDLWQVTGAAGSYSPITPSQQSANRQTSFGFAPTVKPIVIDWHILYVQFGGFTVRQIQYNYWANIFTGTDISFLSNHLFRGHTIVDWAWSNEPDRLVWAAREDGKLVSLTYLPDQEVTSWSRSDTQGQVVSLASVNEGGYDIVYMSVRRTVNAATWYFTERLDPRQWTSIDNCFCLDAGRAANLSAPINSITNADHLEGMAVTAVIDGVAYPNLVVTAGVIVLPATATKRVSYGLPFVAQLQGLHAAVQGGPSIQGKRKRISSASVRVAMSRGFQIGANQPVASLTDSQADVPWANMQTPQLPGVQDTLGEGSLFSGDVFSPVDDDWSMPSQEPSWGAVAIQQLNPFPLSVLSYIANIEIGDTDG